VSGRFSGDVRGKIVIVVRGAPEPSPAIPSLWKGKSAPASPRRASKDIADALSPTHSKRGRLSTRSFKLKK